MNTFFWTPPSPVARVRFALSRSLPDDRRPHHRPDGGIGGGVQAWPFPLRADNHGRAARAAPEAKRGHRLSAGGEGAYDQGMRGWLNKLMRILRWARRARVAGVARGAPVCPSETGATTVPVAEAPPNSLVVLLTRHILSDGEIVILILKPSYLFILITSLRFIAATLLLL